jgi:heat-inducible transcriptional repressor
MALSVAQLSERSLQIFKELVDAYMETGEPIGSRTISRRIKNPLSPATIRNIMADLEDSGLLYAPHTSAGRLPTTDGLKFFVNGLLEIGDISCLERDKLDEMCKKAGKSVSDMLEEATFMLSGLSRCAGLVMAPKTNLSLSHIEFVPLNSKKILVILVTQDGVVENRLIELNQEINNSTLVEITNYINSKVLGLTLDQAKHLIYEELETHKEKLDQLSTKIIKDGLGAWAGGEERSSLIVKGQSNLLQGVSEVNELEKIRELFEVLDKKEALNKLLEASVNAEGVQIFIGSENNLFNLSGCSVIVSPYKNDKNQIIGAIGVIGSSRMNYGRIIPLVDYTAKLIGKLMS